MLFPFFGDTCRTQPLITVKDITLRNITSHGGLLPPGVLRGNETNPMTNITFDNVHSTGIWRLLKWNYYTLNV